MAASLGELFVELGVFADTKELHAFEQKLQKVNKTMQEAGKKNEKVTQNVGKFIKKIAAVATAVTGAIYALNRLTDSLVQSNQEFLNLTRTSDISLDTFQKWNNIGRMLGVKDAAQQIEGLNQRLFELMLTGEGARGFQLAGINPIGQSAEGIMEQLRARVSGMSDTSASYLLKQMGLDPTMLHLLRLSKDEFEALGQTIQKYQLTPEQTRQVQAMNVQLQIAQIKLKYLKDRAVMAIMPYFVKFIESLARVTEFFEKVVSAIDSFLARIPLLKGAIVGLGAVILAYFHPIIAIFTALYLLIDDFMTFLEGGDSVIGHILNVIDDYINDVKEAFAGLIDLFKSLGDIKLPQFSFNPANIISPQARANNSTTNNTDNRQVNQRISINTNQPAESIKAELYHANYAFA